MNGGYSGTLARLAMASGIIIVQERVTTGATSWISFSCRQKASDWIERSRFLRAQAL